MKATPYENSKEKQDFYWFFEWDISKKGLIYFDLIGQLIVTDSYACGLERKLSIILPASKKSPNGKRPKGITSIEHGLYKDRFLQR